MEENSRDSAATRTTTKSDSSTPGPIQIVKLDDDASDHSFYLDEDALTEIMEDVRIRDKPLCIVSVAGAFRRGKSFLLDFLLRFLSNGGKDDWLGSEDNVPLTGFHWRGGADRDTTGILMWSKVFEVKLPCGKDVAVVLMDTQGAFDSNSTVRDCATIFALSAMLSSVLVYNLTSNIQEDDLQHLQLFTEYGRLAIEDSGETPFQKLMFLIRDWSYPYEHDFGLEGGREILDRRLKVSDKQHPELQALRKHIAACFGQMECYLMPHPGLKVATDPRFDGKLIDIEAAFKDHLNTFVPFLLSPSKIQVKKISGNEVKCKELVGFFKAYIDIFKGDEMPEPKSMLEATSEANNLASLSEAKETYMRGMDEVCGAERPYINEHVLEIEHLRIHDEALEVFNGRRKMGGEEFSTKYREKLESEITESFENLKLINENKNIFKAANTPITLTTVAMIFYVASQILGLIGLYPFANVLNIAMMTTFCLLLTWSYCRYTGNWSEIGATIDSMSETVWDSAIQPGFSQVAEQGANFAARQAVQRLNSTASTNSTIPPMSVKKRH